MNNKLWLAQLFGGHCLPHCACACFGVSYILGWSLGRYSVVSVCLSVCLSSIKSAYNAVGSIVTQSVARSVHADNWPPTALQSNDSQWLDYKSIHPQERIRPLQPEARLDLARDSEMTGPETDHLTVLVRHSFIHSCSLLMSLRIHLCLSYLFWNWMRLSIEISHETSTCLHVFTT